MCKYQSEHRLTDLCGSLELLLDINDKRGMETHVIKYPCIKNVSGFHLIGTGNEHDQYMVTLSELTLGICFLAF